MANRRGRPVVYKGEIKDGILQLITAYGLTGTHELTGVSMPTLGKLAKGAGIKLKVGRPKAA